MGFPNALLQYAIEDFVDLSIDIHQLQLRRDRLTQGLSEMGYVTIQSEGTFYLLVQSPVSDDWDFVERLAAKDVYCFPGCSFGLPGYFRLSLTASDEMVERSLPIFKTVLETV